MTSSLFRWAALCTQDVVQEKMFSWSNNLDIFFPTFCPVMTIFHSFHWLLPAPDTHKTYLEQSKLCR